MRKEVFIAIAIGFVLGLIITFGLWSANKAISQKNQKIATATPTSEVSLPTSEVTVAPAPFTLTIISPENGTISKTDKIIVSGSTKPKAEIVVTWETSEDIIGTDDGGNFDISVPLIAGINEITFSAFSDNGDEVTKTVNVVYSTETI